MVCQPARRGQRGAPHPGARTHPVPGRANEQSSRPSGRLPGKAVSGATSQGAWRAGGLRAPERQGRLRKAVCRTATQPPPPRGTRSRTPGPPGTALAPSPVDTLRPARTPRRRPGSSRAPRGWTAQPAGSRAAAAMRGPGTSAAPLSGSRSPRRLPVTEAQAAPRARSPHTSEQVCSMELNLCFQRTLALPGLPGTRGRGMRCRVAEEASLPRPAGCCRLFPTAE